MKNKKKMNTTPYPNRPNSVSLVLNSVVQSILPGNTHHISFGDQQHPATRRATWLRCPVLTNMTVLFVHSNAPENVSVNEKIHCATVCSLCHTSTRALWSVMDVIRVALPLRARTARLCRCLNFAASFVTDFAQIHQHLGKLIHVGRFGQNDWPNSQVFASKNWSSKNPSHLSPKCAV